jgi:hypothetical protein
MNSEFGSGNLAESEEQRNYGSADSLEKKDTKSQFMSADVFAQLEEEKPKDGYDHDDFNSYNDQEAKEMKTPLMGETTLKEIKGAVKPGVNWHGAIPHWAEWAFKPRQGRDAHRARKN